MGKLEKRKQKGKEYTLRKKEKRVKEKKTKKDILYII